ncbi:hypothetical protein B0H66DRAFT_313771 [Apodospora peruviana]|uniref:Uncharacterized protein n=1 Tax=Apodospora peruviana TaxID=516989 RepID=A0AAE0M1C6_9PEZI|nr:hypothetical protein B0H66DRAFT_313771 [Apodospora peruviana]
MVPVESTTCDTILAVISISQESPTYPITLFLYFPCGFPSPFPLSRLQHLVVDSSHPVLGNRVPGSDLCQSPLMPIPPYQCRTNTPNLPETILLLSVSRMAQHHFPGSFVLPLLVYVVNQDNVRTCSSPESHPHTHASTSEPPFSGSQAVTQSTIMNSWRARPPQWQSRILSEGLAFIYSPSSTLSLSTAGGIFTGTVNTKMRRFVRV